MPLSYVAVSASSSPKEFSVLPWGLAKSADDSNGVVLALIVCAAPGSHHARARRQAARDGGALVDLVDDPRVVPRECDAVRHRFSSLLLVQPGDLALAFELGLLAVGGGARRLQSRRAARQLQLELDSLGVARGAEPLGVLGGPCRLRDRLLQLRDLRVAFRERRLICLGIDCRNVRLLIFRAGRLGLRAPPACSFAPCAFAPS